MEAEIAPSFPAVIANQVHQMTARGRSPTLSQNNRRSPAFLVSGSKTIPVVCRVGEKIIVQSAEICTVTQKIYHIGSPPRFSRRVQVISVGLDSHADLSKACTSYQLLNGAFAESMHFNFQFCFSVFGAESSFCEESGTYACKPPPV